MNMDAVIKRLTDRMAELDVKPQYVSLQATGKTDTVRNWLRKHANGETFSMRQDNLAAVASVLGVSLLWLISGSDNGTPAPAGLAEETTPFIAKPSEEQAVRALYAASAKHPQIGRRLQIDLPGLGLYTGDAIVMDLGREAVAGELVLVTVEDGTTHGSTVIRRYYAPYLLALTAAQDTPPMQDNQPGVRVRYPVIGSIRGI